jgi:hypothetical protein
MDEKTLREEAEESWLEKAKTQPEGYLALARHYSVDGDKRKCLLALEKAWAAKVFPMPFIAVDPLWEPVRAEPLFLDILRRMNL